MKKLNENSVRINIDAVREEMGQDFELNPLRDELIAAGAEVSGDESTGTLYMVIDGLDTDEVADICDEYGIDIYDPAIDSYSEDDESEIDESDEYAIPEYDDVDIDEDEDIDDLDEDEYEDLTGDEFGLELPDEEYENDDEWDDEDELLDYQEISEKKKNNCCPGVKHRANAINESKKHITSKKMVNLSESLKRLSTDEIIEDVKKHAVLTESVINKALNKVKKENKANKYKAVVESLGTTKTNKILSNLKSGKPYLYENKSINKKKLSEYTTNELLDIYNKLKDTVNESDTKLTKLLNILNEELTYRITREKFVSETSNDTNVTTLNESEEIKKEDALNDSEEIKNEDTLNDSEEIKNEDTLNEDDADPFAMLSVDPNDSGDTSNSDENKEETAEDSSDEKTEDNKDSEEESNENPEEDEEVELSRIIITLANKDAADDLKSSLVDAGVPEDAIEIEEESDEDTSDENEESEEENTEETSEETSEENTSESIHYKNLRKLFEDDGETSEEENTEESSEESVDGNSDEESTEESSEESSEDETDEEKSEGEVKLILVDTDYIDKLQQVLLDVYGIEEEEFEEMIGGSVVKDESDDSSDEGEDSKDSEDSESSEENKESDSEESEDNADTDDLSPEDLFKGL